MWQPWDILNVLSTSTFSNQQVEKVFWKKVCFNKFSGKTKTYLKKLEYLFLCWEYWDYKHKVKYIIFFWKKFVWVWELLINSWFNLPITQKPILLLFASAWVLYEGVFSLWVFLTQTRPRGQSEGITPWFFRYLVF